MLEIERRREVERTRRGGEPVGNAQGGSSEVDYYSAVDNLISSTISSNSEAFNLQIEQENGQ